MQKLDYDRYPTLHLPIYIIFTIPPPLWGVVIICGYYCFMLVYYLVKNFNERTKARIINILLGIIAFACIYAAYYQWINTTLLDIYHEATYLVHLTMYIGLFLTGSFATLFINKWVQVRHTSTARTDGTQQLLSLYRSIFGTSTTVNSTKELTVSISLADWGDERTCLEGRIVSPPVREGCCELF